MTTTPILHELARDPQAFDTKLADLTAQMGDQMREVASMTSKLHVLAGDKKSYRNTRVPVWSYSDLEVEREAQRKAAHGDAAAKLALTLRASAQAMLDAINYEIANMNAVYNRQGNRWTRFFPSVTKSQPHIHRSLSCHTLHATTVMRWAPEMSGRTDEEAVAELDEKLCSVCFPGAPVALHNYVSRKSQEQVAARTAEKDARATAQAAKRLTEAEQFKTTGRYGERVETVAACKALIRKASQALAELEWTRANGSRVWTDPEALARVTSNREDNLAEATVDAKHAEAVLLARESRHEGHGATMEAIEKMKATALKNARMAWAKN
jgi:hypothetical protein